MAEDSFSKEEKKGIKKLVRYLLIFIAIIVVIAVGAFGYLYYKGGEDNYTPPETESLEAGEQIKADLEKIGKALDSYYSINLMYPGSLSELVPQFLESLPYADRPGLIKYQSDGENYTIVITKPEKFNYKSIIMKNGKIQAS